MILAITLTFISDYLAITLEHSKRVIAKWKNIVFNNLDESYFYNSIAAVNERGLKNYRRLPIIPAV